MIIETKTTTVLLVKDPRTITRERIELDASISEVKRILRAIDNILPDRRIEAIKVLRGFFDGLGLRQAKLIVDDFCDDGLKDTNGEPVNVN